MNVAEEPWDVLCLVCLHMADHVPCGTRTQGLYLLPGLLHVVLSEVRDAHRHHVPQPLDIDRLRGSHEADRVERLPGLLTGCQHLLPNRPHGFLQIGHERMPSDWR